MTLRPFIAAAACVGLAAAAAGSAAPVVGTQFEPETCTLNLASSYAAAPDGFIAAALPTDGLITCPPGVTIPPPEGGDAVLLYSSQLRLYGPQIQYSTRSYFDAGQNAIMTESGYAFSTFNNLFFVDFLNALGGSKATPQASFDQVVGNNGFESPAYVHDDLTGKNYRIVLSQPVQIVPTTSASTTCKVKLNRSYAWKWGSEGYWVIPDSAVQCPGVTFNSAAFTVWLQFNSRLVNQGVLYTASRDVYNPKTKNYSKVFELRLANNTTNLGSVRKTAGAGIQIPLGLAPSLTTGGGTTAPPASAPVWGRFSLGTSTSPEISRDGFAQANGLPSRQFFQVAVSPGSFAIKRATTVKLKARAAGEGQIRLSITADRNASFENAGVGPTYRRQTVLPNTPADHAILKRGSTVLRRVKLSPYGTASVTVPDPTGRTRYSVTLVETDDNFAGSAKVVR